MERVRSRPSRATPAKRRRSTPAPPHAAHVLALQSSVGNRAVTGLLQRELRPDPDVSGAFTDDKGRDDESEVTLVELVEDVLEEEPGLKAQRIAVMSALAGYANERPPDLIYKDVPAVVAWLAERGVKPQGGTEIKEGVGKEDEQTRFKHAYSDALAQIAGQVGTFMFSNTDERPHFDDRFWTCTLVCQLKKGGTRRVQWSADTASGWKSIVKQTKEVDFEYELKSDVRPSTAVLALYQKPDVWALDCVDFVVAARLYAECVAGGENAFDQKYTNVGTELQPKRMSMAQHNTPKLGSKVLWRREQQGGEFVVEPGAEKAGQAPANHAQEALLLETLPVGTRVMWTTTHEEAHQDFENENTIKIGPDLYAAHPLGVKNAAGVRQDMVVEPDDVEEFTHEDALAQEREHIFVCEIEFYDEQ